MQPARRNLLLVPLGIALLASLSVLPAVAADRTLTLSRLDCYDGCPSYQVTLHESGKLEIQGRKNVPWIGTHKEKGPASAVLPVFENADAVGFAGFRPAYGVGCPMTGAAGMAELSLTTGGVTKKVRFQTRCSRAEGDLAALEGLAAQVDRTALTPQRLQAMGAPAETTPPPVVVADSSPPPVAPEPEAEEPVAVEPPEPLAEAPAPAEELPELEELPALEEPEEPAVTATLDPAAVERETDTETAEVRQDIASESPTEVEETLEGEVPEAGEPESPSTVEESERAALEELPVEEEAMEEPRHPEPPSAPGSDGAMPGSVEEDPEVPARELLGRFEQAYNACDIEAMRDVVELDADTESFLSQQCSRCGGFDVDVELVDWVEAPNRVDLYFEQRVRCRRSRTLSIFDLVAEVPRSASPWRIHRIGQAP